MLAIPFLSGPAFADPDDDGTERYADSPDYTAKALLDEATPYETTTPAPLIEEEPGLSPIPSKMLVKPLPRHIVPPIAKPSCVCIKAPCLCKLAPVTEEITESK
jgi:hypothetical protein